MQVLVTESAANALLLAEGAANALVVAESAANALVVTEGAVVAGLQAVELLEYAREAVVARGGCKALRIRQVPA